MMIKSKEKKSSLLEKEFAARKFPSLSSRQDAGASDRLSFLQSRTH
jgi:hypothetical protein